MHEQTSRAADKPSLLEQWKTTINAQMHFNDMLMRARSLAATVVIGVFGAAAALVGQYPTRLITVCRWSVHISAVVIAFGLVLLLCVFLLDYLYYYRLLLAAVERGEVIERELSRLVSAETVPSFSLSLYLSQRVSRHHAEAVLMFFYGIPVGTGLVFLFYLLVFYQVSQ
ncbi:MAG TPA: hypothetical protein VGK94_11220 [Candidatus Polarisedimenticolia bacterium]|jgi:hypothetical protein